MGIENAPVNHHDYYHAHVYFEQETLAFATKLCEQAGERFGLSIGRVHQKNVGPHPKWSCQISFSSSEFDLFIPWLEKERHGLTVLVHALTGNNLKDHTDYAYWLGKPAELNLSIFKN
ncbi:DOPA 4,5-dioxygenase family protein [Neptuniibacter sp. 2_MG-2023]|uniref:DOPA 4,5-dioxygenase family protein n=1 Tax=Neptuniibacter sp. 2_MG-2023 TaxID=3062671 RepID=UPI0026E2359B|nr:DOPA 4,5-dioxygenase family protein [Neptuniibacter sp. 2_MG-2023]MDO6514307.1 DOPA 4,5-dioxygenase family protein [Neptuniibacter sp. 2_MG-2023]